MLGGCGGSVQSDVESNRTRMCAHSKTLISITFEYTAKSKKNKNSWLVWRQVVGYLTSKLDELKNNNTYDWSAADPVAPRTLMFVAQLVPAAPHREGVRKRRVLPSKNSVGTVRKNISLLR